MEAYKKIASKICGLCKKNLPISAFFHKKGTSDGYTTRCKACVVEKQKEFSRLHPEEVKKWSKNSYWRNREKRLERAKKYQQKNAVAICDYYKKYYTENKEKIRERIKGRYDKRKSKNWNLQWKFGITVEQFEQMEIAQGGKCAVCSGDSGVKNKKLAVDHNHVTGCVRGLLCRGCNAGIGSFEDDISMLLKCAKYLKNSKEAELDVLGRLGFSKKPNKRRFRKQQLKVTEADFEKLIQAQDNKCALCGGPACGKEQKLAVDHDHDTGKIRGLLCHLCNMGLGGLKDSFFIVEKAIAYLQSYEQRAAA